MRKQPLTPKSFIAIMSGAVRKGKGVKRLQIVERTAGHYEVQDVEWGKVFMWVPGNTLIECDCGQSFTAEGATAASCPRCDADHTGVASRGLGGKPLAEEEAYRPTRREYEAWMKDEGSHRRHPERVYGGGLFSGLAAKDEMNRVLDVLYGT
jgi:hypothetical protein